MAVTETVFVQEFRRNWQVLVVAFVFLLFAFSAPGFALPFLYNSVIEEFGWSREQATLLASAKYLTGSVVSIIVGRFIDVIGVRNVLMAVSAIGGLALVSFLWVSSLPMYYFAGVMLGIASPGTVVAIKVLVSRTFHASQGTAMGIATLGMAVGAIVVPLIITVLIQQYGWRNATALMSSGIWLLALPIMLFFSTEKSFTGSVDTSQQKSAALSMSVVRQFFGQRSFWLIGAAVFCAAFVDQAFIQHQVLYLQTDLGISATLVAAGISAMGLIGMASRPLVGSLFDKLSIKGVSLTYLMLTAAALLALAAVNPYVFGAFIVFRAVAHSAVLLDTTVLAKHTFGLANIGILLGVYTAIVNLGFALGPWFMGYMFDTTGSYVLPFSICAAVGVFAAVVLLPVKPHYWLDLRKSISSGSQTPGDATPATAKEVPGQA